MMTLRLTDFHISVNATHSKPLVMLDAKSKDVAVRKY